MIGRGSEILRYLVSIYGKSDAFFEGLDNARRYAMTKVSDGNRGYIFTDGINSRPVGVVIYDVGGIRWWHSKNKTWLLNGDGSLKMTNAEYHKRKKTQQMHPFGL